MIETEIKESLEIFLKGLHEEDPYALLFSDNNVVSLIRPKRNKFTLNELKLIIGVNILKSNCPINDTVVLSLNDYKAKSNSLFYLEFGLHKKGNILLINKNQIRF